MREAVVELLNNLNRNFYDTFAAAFAASRGNAEPGLSRVFASIQPGSRVLDLGCGHGRVATMLPADCTYVGMDFSATILDIAEKRLAVKTSGIQTDFVIGDLLADEWPSQVADPQVCGAFDWVVLRAVLHHIPGKENRVAVIRRAAKTLAPGGYLLIANWQFLEIERLRRRMLSWDEIGLRSNDVELGDYLLDWQRDGHGIRYAHLIDEDETRELAAQADLHLETMFRADGHTNNLTLYALLTTH